MNSLQIIEQFKFNFEFIFVVIPSPSKSIFRNLFQDIETFDLEDFKYNSVNITAFRMVDVDHTKVIDALQAMERFQPIGQSILNGSCLIQVSISNHVLLVKMDQL